MDESSKVVTLMFISVASFILVQFEMGPVPPTSHHPPHRSALRHKGTALRYYSASFSVSTLDLTSISSTQRPQSGC